MKAGRGLALAMTAITTACVAAPPPTQPKGVAAQAEPRKVSTLLPLKNGGFENPARPGERCPESWGCTMHSDPDSFAFKHDGEKPAEGKQSLCIERVHDEPWAIATQPVYDPRIRGKRLRFSLALRIDRAAGAGAGPWILVHGTTGNLAHEERPVKRTEGWQRASIEFTAPAAAQMVEVGAILHGDGRVCIDDARLEVLGD